MDETYCSDCGAELDPGDRYCGSCGAKVTAFTDEGSDRWGERDDPADRWDDDPGRWDDASSQQSETGGRATPDGDRTFAAVTHVLALLTWVIGPLVVLVATDDEFVEQNARNALNWQIMFTIYMLVSFVLLFLLIGIVFLMLVPLLDIVFCIIAAVKANDGEAWTYPLTPDIV
ncbi:DUF4870 domain-containing protein [Natrononativus amylolyticus]|uniref:DUF4870 domain-containing protein n=1 Tax=Natrononativus amylolyticus TaxID=2963434 RepID=UPI0020CE05D6|nr:DUF4870 domain-containing protein [Natrononativus amylolyticus]